MLLKLGPAPKGLLAVVAEALKYRHELLPSPRERVHAKNALVVSVDHTTGVLVVLTAA